MESSRSSENASISATISSLEKPSRFIAPDGQAATQAPQALHSLRSTLATRCPSPVSLNEMAPARQVEAHTPHPEHWSSATTAVGPKSDGRIFLERSIDIRSWSLAFSVAVWASREWIHATCSRRFTCSNMNGLIPPLRAASLNSSRYTRGEQAATTMRSSSWALISSEMRLNDFGEHSRYCWSTYSTPSMAFTMSWSLP